MKANDDEQSEGSISSVTLQQRLDSIVEVLGQFSQVAAIGLSGSYALGNPDLLSDLDILVFAQPIVPDASLRREIFARSGWNLFNYFDVAFDLIVSDCAVVDGMHVDINWLQRSAMKKYLRDLSADLDGDGGFAGSLLQVVPLHDPNHIIAELKAHVPVFSAERSAHLITRSMRSAHASLYVLRWLEKAVLRDDYFSFAKNQYEILEHFFSALFALNRQWLCHEKRVAQIAAHLEIIPTNLQNRLHQILSYIGPCSTLEGSLNEIKALFTDLAELASKTYPDMDIPQQWN